MKLGEFVVLSTMARAFDTFDDAAAFARQNYPSIVCERVLLDDGKTTLRERARFDMLWDAARAEWRVMLG